MVFLVRHEKSWKTNYERERALSFTQEEPILTWSEETRRMDGEMEIYPQIMGKLEKYMYFEKYLLFEKFPLRSM